MEKVIQSATNFWEVNSLRIKVYAILAAFVIFGVWPWTVGVYHIIF